MTQEEFNDLVLRLKQGDKEAEKILLDFLLSQRNSNIDTSALKIQAKYKLEKFEGEKIEGDGKEPIEIIEGEI